MQLSNAKCLVLKPRDCIAYFYVYSSTLKFSNSSADATVLWPLNQSVVVDLWGLWEAWPMAPKTRKLSELQTDDENKSGIVPLGVLAAGGASTTEQVGKAEKLVQI